MKKEEKIQKKKDTEKANESQEKKWPQAEGELVIDLYQTEADLVIRSAIAGIKAEDLDISIDQDLLTIRGNREEPKELQEKNSFYQECYWGPFSREIILPVEVDSSRVQAAMKEGILTIKIPKINKDKKRKIKIKE